MVVIGIVEVDYLNLCASDRAVVAAILDRHAVHDHAVKGAVAGLQCRTFRAGKLAEGIVQGCGGESGVEFG